MNHLPLLIKKKLDWYRWKTLVREVNAEYNYMYIYDGFSNRMTNYRDFYDWGNIVLNWTDNDNKIYPKNWNPYLLN